MKEKEKIFVENHKKIWEIVVLTGRGIIKKLISKKKCNVNATLKILQNSLATWFNSPEVCNFIEKEALAQVFPCEFWQIFKNTYFEKHLRTAASNY